jgi:hypothetical protein
MTEKKVFSSEYCERLIGRVTDAKNRVWVGSQISDALKKGKTVYIVIGELEE